MKLNKESLKFIDLFSGIGGFRSALERLGHECIGFSEIDEPAIQSYKALYDTENEIEFGDISKISDSKLEQLVGQVDIVGGGSPCQSFSLAGKRSGFNDTRGTLFFEYARVVKDTQPKYFIYENVKGILSNDNGRTFETMLNTFNELGYYFDFDLFNSRYFGVPQNRERVYVVGVRKDLIESPVKQQKRPNNVIINRKHNWALENMNAFVKLLPDLPKEEASKLEDILDDNMQSHLIMGCEFTRKISLKDDLSGTMNRWAFRQRNQVYSRDKYSPTLLTTQGGNDEPKIVLDCEKFTQYAPNGPHNNMDGVELTLTSRSSELYTYNTNKTFQNHSYLPELESVDYNVSITLTPDLIGTVTENLDGRLLIQGDTIYRENDLINRDELLSDSEYHYIYDSPKLLYPNFRYVFIFNDDFTRCDIVEDMSLYFSNDNTYKIIRTIYDDEIEIIGYNKTDDILKEVPAPMVRRLSSNEYWRLQGFADEQFNCAKDSGTSNTQLLKQAGNSVTVDVVYWIAKYLTKH